MPKLRSMAPIVAILIVGLGVRLTFGVVNRFAEDDHYKVIQLLMERGTYPAVTECWECFQPPAFYRLSASWLRLVAALGLPTEGVGGIHAIQVMNSLLGFGTLLVVLFWLRRLHFTPATCALTLALLAFNPKLVVINGQVTNDSLVIFFGTVALAGAHLFYLERGPRYLYTSAAAAALAALTKGSGLPVLAVLTVCLLFFPPAGATLSLLRRAALVAAVWLFAFFGGDYDAKLAEFGTPFALIAGKPVEEVFPQNAYLPLLYDHDQYFSEEFAAKRPPWGAIAWESFVTFRPLSLLAEPWNDKSPEAERGEKRSPPHMRSVWTQIFARANAIGFHPEPRPYANTSAASHWLSRALFLCALPVALVVMIAWVRAGRSVVRDLVSSGRARAVEHPAFVPLVAFLATAAFAAAYNFHLGHFAATKPDYYFPGLLAYLYFFAVGREGLSRRKGLQRALDATVVLLLVLDLIEVGSVIARLRG